MKAAISLGFLYGVQVIVEPQLGEKFDNSDPTEQSRLKIEHVSSLPNYQGRDVLFLASDTVGKLNGVDLGKPRNDLQFPDIKVLGEVEFERQLPHFKVWYLLTHYAGIDLQEFSSWYSLVQLEPELMQTALTALINCSQSTSPIYGNHINALLAQRGDQTEIVLTQLRFEIPAPKELMRKITVFLESGGGGVTQQLINWMIGVIDQINDDRMREVFSKLPSAELKWYLLFHLMGVPAWEFNNILSKFKK